MDDNDVRIYWDKGILWMTVVGFDLAIPMEAKTAKKAIQKLKYQERYIDAQIIIDELDQEESKEK